MTQPFTTRGNYHRAAQAAEDAAAQGQFWSMHDTLFAHQQKLENGYLVEYANDLGLDIPQFLKDLSKQVYVDRIHDRRHHRACDRRTLRQQHRGFCKDYSIQFYWQSAF
ncbi:DsbA family protein [Capilliphycus salinus ALCB114379]|uniref:DsbA family protein n=1 Tax=Capilliphycus salinus TaxID=2768948 RepID=UPI0039A71737